MTTRMEQLLLGETTGTQLKEDLVLLVVLLAWAQYSGTEWLIIPLLLAGLLSPRKLLLPLSLALSFPQLGHGYFPLLLGISFFALIESFRARIRREGRLAEVRGELLQTLVHELRNPLFAAKGTIDALMTRDRDISPTELQGQLAMASGAMQAINQEVDDLTQLLRLESGRLQARQSRVELSSVFASLQARFPQSRYPDRTIEFVGGDLVFTADHLLLTQALDKLISNALVHSADGPIRVRGFHEGKEMVLEVEDEGPGIPVAQREMIFERFRQLSPNTIGFGLGLYLARQYVAAQGGTLKLQDTSMGCLFRIRLKEGARDD